MVFIFYSNFRVTNLLRDNKLRIRASKLIFMSVKVSKPGLCFAVGNRFESRRHKFLLIGTAHIELFVPVPARSLIYLLVDVRVEKRDTKTVGVVHSFKIIRVLRIFHGCKEPKNRVVSCCLLNIRKVTIIRDNLKSYYLRETFQRDHWLRNLTLHLQVSTSLWAQSCPSCSWRLTQKKILKSPITWVFSVLW